MYSEKEQATSTEAIVAATGYAVGAVVGIIAGPAGVVAGAIVGSVAGAAAGAMLADSSRRKWHHDEVLDTAIGVYDGAIGAASPDAPKAKIGAFSSGSSGSAGITPSIPPPSEGPMQDVEA